MTALLTAIVTWLSINFALPASYDLPTIALAPAAHITEMRYGPGNANAAREVMAVYEDSRATIHLAETWAGRTPAELSILVHEMVHHLQNVAALSYACPAEREALAYDAQAQWLALFEQSLRESFQIDGLTLKILTQCIPH